MFQNIFYDQEVRPGGSLTWQISYPDNSTVITMITDDGEVSHPQSSHSVNMMKIHGGGGGRDPIPPLTCCFLSLFSPLFLSG